MSNKASRKLQSVKITTDVPYLSHMKLEVPSTPVTSSLDSFTLTTEDEIHKVIVGSATKEVHLVPSLPGW